MNQPQCALIVIGDEILSGRTRDINVQVLATRLMEKGARLAEVAMIPDEEARIVDTITRLRGEYDFVFTSGGIGPTHDDITADSVAKAFDVGIDIREDAKQILSTNYANGEADLNPARLRMARIPDGATLIANPISKAPGFQIGNVMVMAGVPSVFAAMLDDALTRIPEGAKRISDNFTLRKPESALAARLGQIAVQFPELSIGSYPFEDENGYGSNIVASGFDADAVAKAMTLIRDI